MNWTKFNFNILGCKMNLQQIAQQAMDYLDSVGVAAEYEIKDLQLIVYVGDYVGDKTFYFHDCLTMFVGLEPITTEQWVMNKLKETYPQKSPE